MCEQLFETMLDCGVWLPEPLWSMWAEVCDCFTTMLHIVVGV